MSDVLGINRPRRLGAKKWSICVRCATSNVAARSSILSYPNVLRSLMKNKNSIEKRPERRVHVTFICANFIQLCGIRGWLTCPMQMVQCHLNLNAISMEFVYCGILNAVCLIPLWGFECGLREGVSDSIELMWNCAWVERRGLWEVWSIDALNIKSAYNNPMLVNSSECSDDTCRIGFKIAWNRFTTLFSS